MPAVFDPDLKTRGLRRVAYDRLVALGTFVSEHVELLDGLLVVREPQGSPHAAIAAHIGQVLASAFGRGWHPRLHSPLALDDDSEPEPDAPYGWVHRSVETLRPAGTVTPLAAPGALIVVTDLLL